MKKSKKWYLALMGCFYIVGSIIGLSLGYIIKGKFNFSILIVAITGALILVFINVVIVFLKRKKTIK